MPPSGLDNGGHPHALPAAPQPSAQPLGTVRVAALIDTVQVSGPGRQLAALARCLALAGVELRVVTFHRAGRDRSPYLDHLERNGVTYRVIPERGPWDLGLIPRLRHVLADWAPSIVQTHGYKPTALAYALRRTGGNWPWIAFFHGATSEDAKTRFYHWFDRRMMARADRVVTMSARDRAGFSHLGAKACLMYNAVIPGPRAERLSPGATLEPNLAGESSRPVIGVVGRLSPEKGVDVFLRACRELANRNVPFSAIVAGDGPQRHDLEVLRDSLRLGDRVRLVGTLSAVEALYSHLDLLVIPSRSEGLPNVLLEGLHADVPVVATRVGAIPEVIDSPLAGTLVAPNAPSALADAIQHSLAPHDDHDAKVARRTIAQRFSLERRAMEHLKLYAEVLQRPELARASFTEVPSRGLAPC